MRSEKTVNIDDRLIATSIAAFYVVESVCAIFFAEKTGGAMLCLIKRFMGCRLVDSPSYPRFSKENLPRCRAARGFDKDF